MAGLSGDTFSGNSLRGDNVDALHGSIEALAASSTSVLALGRRWEPLALSRDPTERMMALVGVDEQTAQAAHLFVTDALEQREWNPHSRKGVLRTSFGHRAAPLEVVIDLQQGRAFFKTGYDQVLSKGASKAAVLAYDYFSDEPIAILKALSSLNCASNAPAAGAANTGASFEPTLAGSKPLESAPQTAGTQGDSKLAPLETQASEGAYGTSVFHELDTEARAKEKELAARWDVQAHSSIPKTPTTDQSVPTSPLDSMPEEQRELFIAQDLSGMPGIMSSLFVDQDSGDIYQRKAQGDFRKLLMQVGPGDRQVVDVLKGALDGLVSLHAKGYIHRDIKPENLLVLQRDSHLEGALSDFGSACHARGDSQLYQYASTVIYGSPEISSTFNALARGSEINERSDIWSMGLILYESTGKELASHPVFNHIVGSSPPMVLSQLSLLRPEAAGSRAQELREKYIEEYPEPDNKNSLDHLIWRCMRLDPQERPTALELKEAYSRIVG